jgi:hypothetical protein
MPAAPLLNSIAAANNNPEEWRRRSAVLRQEARVVAVIEGKEEAFGARLIEFKVHRSDGDPALILGSWRFGDDDATPIDQSKPNNLVTTEFRHVVDCADQHGIPFVWVNDPDELFPPWERPIV